MAKVAQEVSGRASATRSGSPSCIRRGTLDFRRTAGSGLRDHGARLPAPRRRLRPARLLQPARRPLRRLMGMALASRMLQQTWPRTSLSAAPTTDSWHRGFFNFFGPAKGGSCGRFRLGFGFVGFKKQSGRVSAFSPTQAARRLYGNTRGKWVAKVAFEVQFDNSGVVSRAS
jgi:hypothetical protein